MRSSGAKIGRGSYPHTVPFKLLIYVKYFWQAVGTLFRGLMLFTVCDKDIHEY